MFRRAAITCSDRLSRRLVRRVLRAIGSPSIRVVLWDGAEIVGSDAREVARVLIHDRPTLLKLVFHPELHFGDAYTDGRIEVEGDFSQFLETVYRAMAAAPQRVGRVRARITQWINRRHRNTIRGARASIHRHYDIGNDFYRLWLDDEMVYSGAYFPSPDATLEEAQAAKLDYVCRKMWLKPGEHVVEIGGGWGALALHMARHYGVKVKSYNISHRQTVYARERAKAEGLNDRVEFIEDDYRNISGRFDALVSLGMLEHVGVEHYRDFGAMMDRCLGPTGRGLIQVIGQNRPTWLNWWIERQIFPGAYPPSPRQLSAIFEPWEFSLLDLENLRLHYAKTLRHWLARFESSADVVREMFDERFVRAWRLYLAGSAAAFATGSLQLFQALFARPALNQLPSTRAGLYESIPALGIRNQRAELDEVGGT